MLEKVRRLYSAGVSHAFILHLNVQDYQGGVSLRRFLAANLASRQVVVFYNRADGFFFPTDSMKKKFIESVMGNTQKGTPNSALAALGLGQQQEELPRSPSAAIPLIVKFLRMGTPEERLGAVIMEDAETIVPEGDLSFLSPEDRTHLVAVRSLGTDPEIVRSGNIVFLVTRDLGALHSSVRAAASKFEAVAVPFPTYEDRLAFIQAGQFSFDWGGITPEHLARSTAGLSLVHVEDILLRAAQEGMMTLALVKERKDSMIKTEFGDVVQILEPRFGFEAIGGLEYIKDYFVRNVIQPMRDGRWQRVPMGILLTGPAGTGKTAMAEAVAKEANVPFFVLNPAKIFGKYVGDTERNLDRALAVIEGAEQSIVFIDEMDQSVRRGESGDSGVSNRFFKRLLEFMSDPAHRGKIVFLGATNRPDLMDAALRRPGRFDRKIPFLVPDEGEREAIFKVKARQYGLDLPEIPQEAIRLTEGWTGAEIETAVVKAVEISEDYSLPASESLARACWAISPSTADIDFMTKIAVLECNDKDLLPPRYRAMLDHRPELEAEVNRRMGREL